MAYWLAKPGDAQQTDWLTRFEARYWTVNFPRPMMAAVTTTAPDAVRVDAVFYRANDLAGLIWASEDTHDHPLLAYETARDYRGLTLSFRWRASGLIPLDAVYGPTLTIEGRDAQGRAHTWYVRLWNYAKGRPGDATITLDFDRLAGGFLLPGEADPVWAGDIDRIFIALTPPGYSGQDTPLPQAVEAWAELSGLRCQGPTSTLSVGDVLVPPHDLSIASGYDDSYHLTPARLIHSLFRLGYRGAITHYVGMSHYFRLARQGVGWEVTLAGGAINVAAAAWHRDFAARAKAYGLDLILSLSFELFDAHCPQDWKQRAADGSPALTGWSPPSTLLSPANGAAMAYLQSVAKAFVGLAVAAGQKPRFQIGEPWWWTMPDGRICLYDAAAKAALGGAPLILPTVRTSQLGAAEKALLDAAGAVLAAATLALAQAVRTAFPNCERLILIYLPTLLDAAAPDLMRANLPLGWRWPAFDILQTEDYDWVTSGRAADAATNRARADLAARLGYPMTRQHYLAGFVADPADIAQWAAIDAAAEAARARGVAATFLWALPQVLRDGMTRFSIGDDTMDDFDDVDFPLALGKAAQVTAGFSTSIVTSASGHEQRNSAWANARLRFDAGPGVRSQSDVQMLLAFFRARRGPAKAFRFRDPLDQSSNLLSGVPQADDVRLGTGDGKETRFALIKTYGAGPDAEIRRITRPVAASVRVAINAVPQTTGWTLEAGGWVRFDTPPKAGAVITAGFLFDVPVRFEQDQLEVTALGLAAGDVPSVLLVEVREA
jgi:uncharacterized protein (TIGR02217 family)